MTLAINYSYAAQAANVHIQFIIKQSEETLQVYTTSYYHDYSSKKIMNIYQSIYQMSASMTFTTHISLRCNARAVGCDWLLTRSSVTVARNIGIALSVVTENCNVVKKSEYLWLQTEVAQPGHYDRHTISIYQAEKIEILICRVNSVVKKQIVKFHFLPNLILIK